MGPLVDNEHMMDMIYKLCFETGSKRIFQTECCSIGAASNCFLRARCTTFSVYETLIFVACKGCDVYLIPSKQLLDLYVCLLPALRKRGCP